MSGSKTTYYVSSSTFPMFDDSSRVNQYAAAMLDYTANSPIEHSEYIKSFYNTSRLRNYRGYLNWCAKNGFYDTFGKVESDFYSDAKLDNIVVGDAIKHLFTIEKNDTFGVYRSKLSFFSEDFYVKYLATQQGLADKFYEDGDLYYTISYPTDSTIRATLKDGTYVEGPLPTGSANTRFIEVSYSIIREIKEEYYPPEEENPPEEGGTPENNPTDPETPETEEGIEDLPLEPEEPIEPELPKEPIIITRYVTEYGFYHYQEDTGNLILDSLIKENNGIKVEKTFYPPIPLRSNTAWFTGEKEQKINNVLKYLEIRETNSDRETGYEQLKTACSNMEKGSINDIDYITILLGVHLNSDNNSDQKYLFEFFYNLYLNYALKVARPDPTVPKTLYAGSNYIGEFASYAKKGFTDSGYSDSYFTKFNINCNASNLNLTYSWGHSDYFEQNGQWKPEAKVGDYGVLSGSYEYKYSYTVEEWVNSGDDGYWTNVTYTKKVPYTLTAFCHQTSLNRFRMVLFVSLTLTNLIYHGKTINTSAYDAINAASGKEDVTLSFIEDIGKDGTEYSKITLKRVTVTGEIDTPFIVPIEHNTWHEIGVRSQADIAPCSMFLIYNCWVKVKQKWYQRGFFKWVALVVAVVIAVFAPQFAPASIALAVQVAAATAAIVIAVSIAIDLIVKVISTIFGDSLGNKVGGFLQSAWQGLCSTLMWFSETLSFFGISSPYVLAFRIGVTIGLAVINSDSLMVSGESFGTSLIKGSLIAGAQVTAGKLGYSAGVGIENAMAQVMVQFGTQAAISSFAQTYATTDSLRMALEKGLIYGSATAITAGITKMFNPEFVFNDPSYSGHTDNSSFSTSMTDALVNNANAILKNPNTYAELLNLGIQERLEHKLKNLENDFQEFNNKYKAVQDMLDILNAKFNNVITAEYLCKMQLALGRFSSLFPENYSSLTPETIINTSLATGSDVIKAVLSKPSTFVEDSLTIKGYTPNNLYYTQTDNTLTWDIT